ncbi:unnamed protein product [Brassica rapa]|uniref:BZIP domain-containing protein n=2 Tax=Brassica campestris TaxID=3711 RepID=A0A8D9D2B0_BRACM|nr:unnamed protein product [Brassica rapa]
MDRQAKNVPFQTSFVLSTHCPCPPSGQNRGSMPPPRRSSLPPLPPKRPTTARRHQQVGLQNFNPGPRLLPPQSPVFRSWTPMSSPAPSSSFQYFQPAPPVAYHNAALPPRPPTTSVSARGSAYSGNDSAVFPSMDAMRMIYPGPIEMPVGVNYSKEGHGEPAGFVDEQVYMDLDEIFDFSTKDDDVARIGSGSSENNAGVKKRAAPSRKTRRKSVSPSVDCNNNWKSSVAIEKGMFTESQMNEIARCKILQKYVVTDPKYAKRTLSNRAAARRSVQRSAQHILNLEEKEQTLEKEGATLTVHTRFAEKTKLGLEEENMKLRIRYQGLQDQFKRANDKMQRPNSSSSSSLNPSPIRFPVPFTGNRVGTPPPPPIPPTFQPKHSFPAAAVEDRTGAVFSPSLPPSPFTMYHSPSRVVAGGSGNLPPRNSHRRSNSDHTFVFSSMSPPLIPSKSLERSVSSCGEASDWSKLVKEEERRTFSEGYDDALRAYMRLDKLDAERSRGRTRKMTNGGSTGGDSEGESNVKRRAGGDIAPTSGHYRSVSLDSCCFREDDYSVRFGKYEFSAGDMKKIAADETLAGIVMADPKRVKR